MTNVNKDVISVLNNLIEYSKDGENYFIVDEHVHIHLVCDRCENVLSIPAQEAEPFARQLRDAHGFHAEISHLAIHGRCRDCATD